jgi:hypothetical protein
LTWADALNALQHSAMKDVRLTMLRVGQLYSLVEAAKPAVASGTEVPASPQMRARERVTILLEARDSSSRPGDLIASFQEQIQAQPYFKTNVASIEMSGRSSVKTDVGGPSRPYVEFSLQCRFTEREH